MRFSLDCSTGRSALPTRGGGWLLEVVRRTGTHSDAWRSALEPASWEDPQVLAELARAAPVARQSVSLLLALGERLRDVGGDAVPLLKQVQKEYPADFWSNLILGNAMLQWNPVEAGGHYRAAWPAARELP